MWELHQRVRAGMARGEYEQATRLAEELHTRFPDFVPGMNNLSLLYFGAGRSAEAIALARRALEREPDNFHTLGNLAKYLLLTGREKEAGRYYQRLLATRSDIHEIWDKKAEVFAFFGDDQLILDVFEEADAAGFLDCPFPNVVRLYRLAGVAAARLGDEALARRHLREALRRDPGSRLTQENLDELDKPIAERNGPWHFFSNYWLGDRFGERVREKFAQRRADVPFPNEQVIRALVAEFPQLVALVPHLLDRGDELGRTIAWRVAFLLETPELIEALQAFCRSQRGPDELRRTTAMRLYHQERLDGCIRMWSNGKWEERLLTFFQVTDEPIYPPFADPTVQEWAEAAYAALNEGDGWWAEVLLKRCIEREGEQPDLLNNLSHAYHLQRRQDEHARLAREIHARWPDYFFGRIAIANLATAAGNFEEAAACLQHLAKRRQLHATELAAFCAANVDLQFAQDLYDAARSWLQFWKSFQPVHPQLARRERLLGPGSLFGPKK